MAVEKRMAIFSDKFYYLYPQKDKIIQIIV